MTNASDTPGPGYAPKPIGDPPAPPQAPEGDPPPGPTAPPVKGEASDDLTKTGDAGDELGDFA